MSNIIKINDSYGKARYYDFGTKNESFLITARELKELGIKNWYFMLEVKYPHLGVQDIDSYDEHITTQQISAILLECKNNPWFFFREVATVPVSGADKFKLILTRASAAAVWCFTNSLDFMLCQPRQTHKTTWLTAIIEYEFIFEFQNVKIPYMHIRQDRCIQNAELLRDYIMALPPYMNPWNNLNKLPGAKSLKYAAHNTSIVILSQADSEVKAKDKMRGMTLFSSFLDEWEYTPYIDNVMEGATPAIISAREIVRKAGGRCCMMLASTPGDLETATGKAAQRMIDLTPAFTEKLYDFTPEMLQQYFDGVISIDPETQEPQQVTMVYIEFNYVQLRKTEKWVNEQYMEAIRTNKLAEFKRGVLLQRFRGGSGSFFEQSSIDFIQQNYRSPDYDILLLNKYNLYVYKHKVQTVNLNSDFQYFDIDTPYLIGLDCATGKGGDNTAICIVHPYTLQVVGELLSPYMGVLDLMRVVTLLLRTLPQAILCLESNMTGVDIIDYLQEAHMEHRIYHSKIPGEATKNVVNPTEEKVTVKQKAINKKYYGTYVSPKVRDNMMNILRDTVNEYKEYINTKYLVRDVCDLVQDKTGKVVADNGCHDDMVMAYLHTRYVLNYGYKLERFRVDTAQTKTLQIDLIEETAKAIEEDTVDNMKDFATRGKFEQSLLMDQIALNSRGAMVDENGYPLGNYKPYIQGMTYETNSADDEFEYVNGKKKRVVVATKSDLDFFSSVNDFGGSNLFNNNDFFPF